MLSVEISDMTVALFDAWLCDGFFRRLGGALAGQLPHNDADGENVDWFALPRPGTALWYVRRDRHERITRYSFQTQRDQATDSRLGFIQVEQRWASKVIVFVHEDQAGALVASFSNWLKRMGYDEPKDGDRTSVQLPTRRDTTDTRAGTLERAAECHRLRKTGMSLTRAAKQAKTDKRTYKDNCLAATGEEWWSV